MLGYCGFVLAGHLDLSASGERRTRTVRARRVGGERRQVTGRNRAGRFDRPHGKSRVWAFPWSSSKEPATRRCGARSGISPARRCRDEPGNVGIAGHRDTFFRPLAKYPARRHHHAHDAAWRVSLPRGVHEGGESRQRGCVEFRRKRNPDAGHVLSVLLCRLGSRAIYRPGGTGHLRTGVNSRLTSLADVTIAVDQAVLQRLGRPQDVVAVHVALDALERLARGLRQ